MISSHKTDIEAKMQSSHSLEVSLPGVVSSQAEQDDAQLVKASQHGDQDAFILTAPMSTIKTHLFRARNLLKQRLLAQHLADPGLRELS